MNVSKGRLDIQAIRAKLAQQTGKEYWRSLEELAGTEEFKQFLEDEFPHRLPHTGRRQMLRLMGASLALAGFTACTRQPLEKIVPYVRAPEDIIPGKPLFFATAHLRDGYATGVLAESHMGRPTKIEGNPLHPASLGATDIFAQASVLGLWDPDRSQAVMHRGRISTWIAFAGALNVEREAQLSKKGEGLRILTETVVSPALGAQLKALLAEFPGARWHQYQAVSRDNARAGAKLAFGDFIDTHYRFDQADTIVALDADFILSMPGNVRYTRDFIARRRLRSGENAMNRLYSIEPMLTSTGAMADHRLPMRASDIENFARALAAKFGVGPGGSQADARWIDAIAKDLTAHRGRGLIFAGDQQPAAVHALAHGMNEALGNTGNTVIHTAPIDANPVDQFQSLRDLIADMNAGRVSALLILGGNPAYTAPPDLDFANALRKVNFKAHLSQYNDETSGLCNWHIPESHYLETWSDARAYDGTVTILQPLIAPLYGSKSAHEVLIALSGRPDMTAYALLQERYKQTAASRNFDEFWRTALHDGIVPGSAAPQKSGAIKLAQLPRPPADSGIEINFRPDPCVWDGSYSNLGWLQELPKPLTKLTWDNAALMSPATAQRLGVNSEEVVELSLGDRSLRAPAWIVPGHADHSVTVHLGYGRRRAGRIANGVGFDANRLRFSSALWQAAGANVRGTQETYRLACTQDHHSMEGRPIIYDATLDEYRQHPNLASHSGHAAPTAEGLSLYPEYKYDGYKWGMAIDVHACVGCNACVIACQAENNIAVVGKTEVLRGREMLWIRVDRYHQGPLENPETFFQPVPCMHCEMAPCEPVCPVAATVHSGEGLNQMVYNRCIGTRYCSNNCPYKVRRFNFFLYSDWSSESLRGLRNPDVTVRSRGVMEKCTYCVQRINEAKIEAEKEDRRVRDGEVITACQQVCPTQAIVFGDLNDRNSAVAKLKSEPRHYVLLEDLNTRPRTTYLGRVRNVNPDLEKT
jgi:molybdopterin-containing oxidoreductase family iron-sulfur binding subunit